MTEIRDQARENASRWESRALEAEAKAGHLNQSLTEARGEAARQIRVVSSAHGQIERLTDIQTKLQAEIVLVRREQSKTLVEKRGLERQVHRLHDENSARLATLEKVPGVPVRSIVRLMRRPLFSRSW